MSAGYCSNPACGCGPVPLFAGQCRTCYQYEYRHGTPRPLELVIRNAPLITARLMARWAQPSRHR